MNPGPDRVERLWRSEASAAHGKRHLFHVGDEKLSVPIDPVISNVRIVKQTQYPLPDALVHVLILLSIFAREYDYCIESSYICSLYLIR